MNNLHVTIPLLKRLKTSLETENPNNLAIVQKTMCEWLCKQKSFNEPVSKWVMRQKWTKLEPNELTVLKAIAQKTLKVAEEPIERMEWGGDVPEGIMNLFSKYKILDESTYQRQIFFRNWMHRNPNLVKDILSLSKFDRFKLNQLLGSYSRFAVNLIERLEKEHAPPQESPKVAKSLELTPNPPTEDSNDDILKMLGDKPVEVNKEFEEKVKAEMDISDEIDYFNEGK